MGKADERADEQAGKQSGGMTDRRESLKLALGAALIPFLAAGPVHAHGSLPENRISPPGNAMIYRRKLERTLPGGRHSFVVQRDFQVQFSPMPTGGFHVSGHQIAVEVSAPDNLAQLSDLERQRVERGIFPLDLGEDGRILDWPAPQPDQQVAQALDDVRQQFADHGEEIGTLLEALHSASSRLTAVLPDDLFAPAETAREERREIELPWGDHGEVVTRFEASRDPGTHLMRQARRTVTTRLGGEERRSREKWELFPA